MGYYSPIFLIQMFCLYHAYSHAREYYWYFIIMFMPLIGSLIYFYFHFVNHRNIDLVSDKVQNVFSPNSRLSKLKNEVDFADTVSNRLNLANEYMALGQAESAIDEYEKCLVGTHKNDNSIKSSLLLALYEVGDHEAVAKLGQQLKDDTQFKKSKERVAYAFSLAKLDQLERAELEFEAMNANYSNYHQRLNYARFLSEQGRIDEANDLLEILISEIEQMDRMEKRHHFQIIKDIKYFYKNGW